MLLKCSLKPEAKLEGIKGQADRPHSHTNLQEIGKQDERLLSDEWVWVLQTHGDIGDILVHHDSVPDTEITQNDDNIVANCHIIGHLQLSHKGWDALLCQILVL